MKKSNKILAAIFLPLFALIIVAAIVLYCLYPTETLQYANTAWEWLNEPLPIVGVSLLIICFFCIRFIAMSSFGKKNIAKINEHIERKEQEHQERSDQDKKLISALEEKLNSVEKELKVLQEVIYKITQILPNKKVKMLGEEINGKERTNDETKTE